MSYIKNHLENRRNIYTRSRSQQDMPKSCLVEKQQLNRDYAVLAQSQCGYCLEITMHDAARKAHKPHYVVLAP